jgi:hypothetical protein
VTKGQLQRGAVGIATPLHDPMRTPLGLEASLGVVTINDVDVQRAATAVLS